VKYASILPARKIDDPRCKTALAGDRAWSAEEIARFRERMKRGGLPPRRNRALELSAALGALAGAVALALRLRRRPPAS